MSNYRKLASRGKQSAAPFLYEYVGMTNVTVSGEGFGYNTLKIPLIQITQSFKKMIRRKRMC